MSALGIAAGLVGTWLRGRTLERLHQTRVKGRSEVVRILAPGSRLIDLDGGAVLIEVGHGTDSISGALGASQTDLAPQVPRWPTGPRSATRRRDRRRVR
ncbi:hypothetical protein [Actinomadura roseirufa]|uniref:hypothetical protein n=1 Tax=Actinomadura roseirufa TaxID=2094049 RepID=UPI0013F14750|nr:hypothetical protein [Actinomadura roseirufa]